jgi:hypothetical protein
MRNVQCRKDKRRSEYLHVNRVHGVEMSRSSHIRVWRIFSTAKIRVVDNEYLCRRSNVEIYRSFGVLARTPLDTYNSVEDRCSICISAAAKGL